MVLVFAVAAVLLVVGIAFFAVGRETGIMGVQARPAVFEVEEAIQYIARTLPEDVAGRVSYSDVRWILRADAERFEQATVHADDPEAATDIIDQDAAVARILALADEEGEGRHLSDEDIVAVLEARTAYLRAIGAIGPEVS